MVVVADEALISRPNTQFPENAAMLFGWAAPLGRTRPPTDVQKLPQVAASGRFCGCPAWAIKSALCSITMEASGGLSMTKAERHDLASKRAEEYAPTPINTALASGVVGATLVGLASIALGSFYSIDV